MDIKTIELKLKERINSRFFVSVIEDLKLNQILVSVTSDEPFNPFDKILISSEVISVIKNGKKIKIVFKELETYNV